MLIESIEKLILITIQQSFYLISQKTIILLSRMKYKHFTGIMYNQLYIQLLYTIEIKVNFKESPQYWRFI